MTAQCSTRATQAAQTPPVGLGLGLGLGLMLDLMFGLAAYRVQRKQGSSPDQIEIPFGAYETRRELQAWKRTPMSRGEEEQPACERAQERRKYRGLMSVRRP